MTKMGSGASRYAEAVAGMEEFGLTVKGLLRELLRHNGVVVHTIDHRVKTEQSAKRKLARPDGSYQGFSSLHDLLGLRVTCYFSDDVDRIVEILEREFLVDPSRSVDKGKQLGTKEFGYRSVHRVAQMGQDRAVLAEYDRYKSLRFEVQIRTVVQHAWAEIEHDLGYKQDTIPEPMSRRFSMLAGVLELVDYEFMALRDQLEEYEKDADRAARTKVTNMSLDLATLHAIIKYDDSVKRFDQEVTDAAKRTLRDGEPDPKYLERRLSAIRAVGVDTITGMREAVDAWKPHVLDFAPRWIKLMDEKGKREGEVSSTERQPFPRGVGFFYLWLAMGLEATSKGLLPEDQMLMEPGALASWDATIAAVGTPPELPPIRGLRIK